MTDVTGHADGPASPPAAHADADADADARPPLSWPARVLALAGWGVVVLGALGASDRIEHFAGPVPWRRVAMWFIGAALTHDLVIAPLVTLVAIAVGRLLPGLVRGPVAGGLIASGCLVAVSYPRLSGFGALPTNSSINPGNAARDLLVVLGVVWLTVAVTVLVRTVGPRIASRS